MWDSPGYIGELGVRMYLAPLLDKAKVDIVFNGHTHDYERGKLPATGDQGTYYVITGGGGAPLDTVETYDWEHVVIHRSVYHFCIVDVEADRLTLKAIDVNGNIIDSFCMDKSRNLVPDIELCSVTIDPSIPAPGTQAWVEAEVRNSGTAPCPDFRVDLCANQSCTVSQREIGIPAGGKRTIRLPWSPARGGAWILSVSLDSDGQIDEGIYENNNAGSVRCLVSVPRPDLSLDFVRMSLVNVRPRENATLYVGVRNAGSADAPPFNVRVEIEGRSSPWTPQFPALAAGASATQVATGLTFPREGAYLVRVDLDPEDKVGEISERNLVSFTVWVAECIQRGAAYLSKGLVENDTFVVKYDDSIGPLGPDSAACSFVWGIDGWKEPAASIRPPGTSIRWGTAETMMERGIDGLWVLAIPVADRASQVDFTFKSEVLNVLLVDDNDGRSWRWVSPAYYWRKLSELQQLMVDSRTWNVNLSQYLLAVDVAGRLAERGDYATAASMVEEKTKNLGLELVGLMAAQAKVRSDAARQLGLDVRNIEVFLRAAQSHLALGNWRTAWNYVDSAVRALENLDEVDVAWQPLLMLLAFPLLRRLGRPTASQNPNPDGRHDSGSKPVREA